MLGAMQAAHSVTLKSFGPDATTEIALTLAPLLRGGDTVCLVGGLGAGKSHFARTIVQDLTGETDVPSPTFTLVQTYEAAAFEIWHIDLYRLSDTSEVTEIGLDDALGSSLCLIEWPDRLSVKPPDALWIELSVVEDPDQRMLTIRSNAPRWADPIAKLGPSADAANG